MGSAAPGGSPGTHQHIKSRNIALFSILGVIGGAWLLFRAQAPKRNAYVVSDEERALMRGSDGNQTSQGNKTARAPRSLE